MKPLARRTRGSYGFCLGDDEKQKENQVSHRFFSGLLKLPEGSQFLPVLKLLSIESLSPSETATAQLTFVKPRLLSNLVCSFRNSEVLTGESPDMLTRRMLYPWHLSPETYLPRIHWIKRSGLRAPLIGNRVGPLSCVRTGVVGFYTSARSSLLLCRHIVDRTSTSDRRVGRADGPLP
jgi:hypothetical protein